MRKIIQSFLAIAVVLASGNVMLAVQPFANTQPQPKATPYLNLLNSNRATSPYQTLVRPQLETLRRFRDSQLDLDRVERVIRLRVELSQKPPPVLAEPKRQRGIAMSIRPTGHETRFLDNRRFTDLKQYFPPPALR
jgi:hypothetical protein